MRDFLKSRMNASQNFPDDKILHKLKQVKDIYYRTKEDLINDVSQISNVALKSMENGELSKAIYEFEKIVQKLDFDDKYRKGE